MTSLREHARGKWPLIISSLLGEEYVEKSKHQPCPKGVGQDCFRYSDKHGTGNYFCKCSDGASDGFDLLQCVKGWDFARAAEEVEGVIGKPDGPPPEKPKPHWIFRYWSEARGSSRSRYLEARGLSPVWPLRFHRSVPYYDEGKHIGDWPAMLAPIYHGTKLRGVHATYLDGDRKADVPAPRKVYSHLSVRHGFVPLNGRPDAAVLGVAEGIETALAAFALQSGERVAPVWSCLNTSLLAQFTPSKDVRRVIVAGDNDASYAGHAAAYRLAERLTARGICVDVVFPPNVGQDWNDVLTEGQRGAA